MNDWIKWKGGECPVANGVEVEVEFRNKVKHTEKSNLIFWGNDNHPTDVIAYRLLTEQPQHTRDKQPRYQDEHGNDWIDECARTFTKEEFRGAMKFTIGKYIRRLGKKDDILKEVNKIEDYAQRWADYERNGSE